jgi:hypothetical protein
MSDKTFNVKKLLQGISHIFKELDYYSIAKSNIYYHKILRSQPVSRPNFFEKVDHEDIKKKSIDMLNLHERNFKRIEPFLTSGVQVMPLRINILKSFREVAKYYPQDVNLNLLFARILINNDLYADAQTYLQRAIQIDERCDFAWAHLALIAALANDHGQSAYCARKALELGNHLHYSLPKAYVFSLLLLGISSKLGAFDTHSHFQIANGELDTKASNIPPVFFCREGKTSQKPVIFFTCDADYFQKFAKNLLLSLSDIAATVSIHVHLVDPNQEAIDWCERYGELFAHDIILSMECHSGQDLGKNKPYLASCRFIRLPEFMERYKRDYLILDADSVLHRADKLESFLEMVKKPVLCYGENCPVWDTISAPFVFLPYSSVSQKFINHCQKYLVHSFSNTASGAFWYVDQLAIFGAYLENVDDILLAPADLISDVSCGDDAIFWTLSNDKGKKEYTARCEKYIKLRYHLDHGFE